MSLLSFLGISTASAATVAAPAAAPTPEGSFLSVLPMLIIFIAVFYFLLVRPQSKRAKEQRQLLDNLALGDEVLTNGGIIGRIAKLRDNYIVLVVAKDMEMTFQKNAVVSVLPKGTLESMN
jgi:preprotein translocase subunit YajC